MILSGMGLATALLESRGRGRHSATIAFARELHNPINSTTNEIREDWIQVGKINMHYLEKGPKDGPVIVLLQPSGNADPWSWEKVIRALPDNYRVLAPGFQGFGKTILPEGERSTIENLSDSVRGFLSAKGVEGQVRIMGTSAGAYVAMTFAAQTPERVAAIGIVDAYAPQVLASYPSLVSKVLSNPEQSMRFLNFGLKHEGIFEMSLRVYERINGTALNGSETESEQQNKERGGTLRLCIGALKAVRKKGERVPKEVVRGTIEYLSQLPPAFFHIIGDHRRHAETYESMAATIRENVPVRLVIHGGGDLIIKRGASMKLAELLGVDLHPIDGSGHAPHQKATDRFMEIIRKEFLPQERQSEPIRDQPHEHRSLMSRLLRRSRKAHNQHRRDELAA